MRADLCSDDIDDALPIRARFGIEPEREKRIGRRSPIPENPRALLAADGHGLMPLNGAEMIWNRRGHQAYSEKNLLFQGTISEAWPFSNDRGRHTERLDITTRDLVR